MATETNPVHWTKTPGGYQLKGHTLVRAGRTWRLFCENGREYDLGRRASFDHAEAHITG